MRMKEDHFKNGQLKPGYNVQIGTENGFVLGYDIFPKQWPYDAATDSYSCPEGRSLTYVRTVRRETECGYAQDVRIYTSESCEGCSQRDRCTRSQGNRTIQRNEELRRLREKAHARLLSEDGKILRKRRAVEVETVFGQVKGNQAFRRFHLRGNRKVSVEWGLLMIGYNIKRTCLQV